MKVQCDVCKGEQEAAVFCCADEAALCSSCDDRVHSANKLAGKHRRFSLLHPSSPRQFPVCDVCQEKTAFLFCQEDRAVLCRDCDGSIHSANDLTRKHNRFLLTGIKLSPSAAPAVPEATASSDSHSSVAVSSTTATTLANAEECPPHAVSNINQSFRRTVDSAPKQCKQTPVAAKQTTDKKSKATATTATGCTNSKGVVEGKGPCGSPTCGGGGGGGSSSISEYLMKELPGWHVEDLLLESSPAVHPAATAIVFSTKVAGKDLFPFLEADLDGATVGGVFPAEDGGKLSALWVPQVPQLNPSLPPPPPLHGYDQSHHAMATGTGVRSALQPPARQLQHQYQLQHTHRRWTGDDAFTVPDLIAVDHNPAPCKRPCRPSSWFVSSS